MFQNYYKLENDVPTRLHFDDYHEVKRTIKDPDLQKDKNIMSNMFWVDRINGERVGKTFSVLSEGLWSQLKPYVDNNTFRMYDFVITRSGEGYQTFYKVEAIPTTDFTKKDYIGSKE